MLIADIKVEVVAGVVEKKGKYLVGRKTDSQSNSEVWEFPGGKVEAGESIEDALRREWREELEVDIAKFCGPITKLENEEYRLHFCAIEISGTPAAKEHSELAWLEPKKIGRLTMHALDSQFVLKYLL